MLPSKIPIMSGERKGVSVEKINIEIFTDFLHYTFLTFYKAIEQFHFQFHNSILDIRESMLQIVNLAKSFGEQEILHNINLHIKEGEFLALVGESGSGKSTLLRIIAGLEEQSSGEIRKKGIDISKHTPKE